LGGLPPEGADTRGEAVKEGKDSQAPGEDAKHPSLGPPDLIERVTVELARLQTMIDLMNAELEDEMSGTDSGASKRLKEILERMETAECPRVE
jgi:hypothetical protein